MAVSFNKEFILEAIQEVLAEDQQLAARVKPKSNPSDPGSIEVMTKDKMNALKRTGKVEVEPMEEETLSVGHVDDEPGMLKQFAFDTAEYAAKLYKLLHHYEQMEDHVDFPNWWQHKVMMAREYMSKATHYLEFETMKPQIDAAVDGHSEEEHTHDGELDELFSRAKNKMVNYQGHDYEILDIDSAGTFTLIDPKHKLYVNKNQMKQGRVPDVKEPEVEDVPLMNLKEDDDVEPSKKDIKAAEKETGGKKTHFTPEAQNMHNIIKNKITKIEKKVEAGDDYKLDLAALKQYISKPEVRKALGAKHIKGMVSSIISETITEGVSCCGRCGRVHESAQDCKKPYISKDSPRHCKNKK